MACHHWISVCAAAPCALASTATAATDDSKMRDMSSKDLPNEPRPCIGGHSRLQCDCLISVRLQSIKTIPRRNPLSSPAGVGWGVVRGRTMIRFLHLPAALGRHAAGARRGAVARHAGRRRPRLRRERAAARRRQRRPTSVRKWLEPIKLGFDNPSTHPDLVRITRDAVRTIAIEASVPVVDLPAVAGANFVVFFDENGVNGKAGYCFAKNWWKSWAINRGELRINPTRMRDIDRCTVHEAMHAFGFNSHPHAALSVLSYVQKAQRTLTPLDLHLIRHALRFAAEPGDEAGTGIAARLPHPRRAARRVGGRHRGGVPRPQGTGRELAGEAAQDHVGRVGDDAVRAHADQRPRLVRVVDRPDRQRVARPLDRDGACRGELASADIHAGRADRLGARAPVLDQLAEQQRPRELRRGVLAPPSATRP